MSTATPGRTGELGPCLGSPGRGLLVPGIDDAHAVCVGTIVKWPNMPAVEREHCVDSEAGEGGDRQLSRLPHEAFCHAGDPT